MKRNVKSRTARTNDQVESLSLSIRALMDSFKAPADFDYKKVLIEAKLRKFKLKA